MAPVSMPEYSVKFVRFIPVLLVLFGCALPLRAELADGIGRREARYATDLGHPEVLSGATAPRARRLRVGIPVTWRRGWPRACPKPTADAV